MVKVYLLMNAYEISHEEFMTLVKIYHKQQVTAWNQEAVMVISNLKAQQTKR